MNEKPLTLRDHEVRQVLTTGECLVVRPVKPQPRDPRTNFHFSLDGVWLLERRGYENYAARSEDGMSITCPYPIGSRWWVREKWRPVWLTPRPRTETLSVVQYAADSQFNRDDWGGVVLGEKWESPILLSRNFSRLTVEVVETTVEQQDGVLVWSTRVRRVQ